MQVPDKEFVLSELKASAGEFEAAIAAVPTPCWLTRPAGREWSAADCAEHVIIVEERLLARVKGLEHAPEEEFDAAHSRRKDEAVLAVANREQKFRAPEAVSPKGVYADADGLIRAFRGVRSGAEELASGYPEWLRGRFAEHPVLKSLDGHQWMLAIAAHSRRHAAQIRELTVELAEQGGC